MRILRKVIPIAAALTTAMVLAEGCSANRAETSDASTPIDPTSPCHEAAVHLCERACACGALDPAADASANDAGAECVLAESPDDAGAPPMTFVSSAACIAAIDTTACHGAHPRKSDSACRKAADLAACVLRAGVSGLEFVADCAPVR